jgi:hypothetical protein
MQDTINEALVGAVERMESEASLAPALSVISDMADVADSRMVLEQCVEQLTMADGSVVDVLEAEQSYLDWRATHHDVVRGRAQTGDALVDEIRVTMEMLNNPSMESDLVQQLKRTFGSMTLTLKTFGKDLIDIKSKISQNKDTIAASPVLLDSAAAYAFLTRDNKPVKLVGSIDEDLKFIDAAMAHYQRLFNTSTDLSKRFREACSQDDDGAIREAVDYFDEHLIDRTEFEDLTGFHLLGNRTVYLDKRGFPQFKKDGSPWKFTNKDTDENGLKTKLAKKQIHGFTIGGPLKAVTGVVGMNDVAAKRQVLAQVKSTGGETDVSGFLGVVDKAINLNNQTVKFAQMAATMSERIERLMGDMDDSYRFVNTEKSVDDNVVRLRTLRALYRSARRSVSQYMFLGKAIATVMEDHASYVYRNITIISNEVLKKSK